MGRGILNWRRAAAVALLLAGAAAVVRAQAEVPPPFLWKVEAPGLKPSWVFGTIHLPRPELTILAPSTTAALKSADAVFTEIPMDPATVLALTPRMLLPEGRTLADVLPADLLEDLKEEFALAAPTMPFQPFERLKPWAVAMNLVVLPDQLANPGKVSVDSVLYQRAAMAGKETGGIETPEEQLGIFDALSDEEEVTFLRDTIAQLRTARAQNETPTDVLSRLYLAGDLAALSAEVEKWSGASSDPALMKKFMTVLLDQRNDRMAERIIERMRTAPNKSFLFAVGAAHLDGDNGILAQLEKAGFTTTRAE